MTYSQSLNLQDLPGESRGSRSLHKSVNNDDVWHSVWKRIESSGRVTGATAGGTEDRLQAPRDYVVELGQV